MECNFENCGYYTDGECNICGMGISGEDTFCRLCKDNPNCYYKQLKRLQQDYVNLSKSFEHLQSSYQDNQEYCLQLKAENDRLKEEIKEVKKYQYQQEYLDKEIEEMQKALKTLAEGLNKRQMLLQEIKEIAEQSNVDCIYRISVIRKILTKAEGE